MSNLTRYNLEWFNRTNTMDNFHQMVANDNGAWVKFDDIKEFLNSSHSQVRHALGAVGLVLLTGLVCQAKNRFLAQRARRTLAER